ncbi:MAG: hypothetical protein V4596_13935 [Bdellovibrionota bacterium]
MKITAFRKKSYFFRIIVLSRELEAPLVSDLRKFKLSVAESLSLIALYSEDENEIRLGDISKIFGYQKSLISHAISKLETEGLLKRSINLIDKRRYKLIITEKGKKIVPKLVSIFNKHDDRFETLMNTSERDSLDKIFKKSLLNP